MRALFLGAVASLLLADCSSGTATECCWKRASPSRN